MYAGYRLFNCASPHRYNVSPLLGERMQAIDRNDETDLNYLDLKPLTELRPADPIAPEIEGVAWW